MSYFDTKIDFLISYCRSFSGSLNREAVDGSELAGTRTSRGGSMVNAR